MLGPLWVCAAITAISALVSFGYSLAGLRGSSGVARPGSMYAFSRSLALLVAAIVALLTGSAPFIAAIAVVMVMVQAGDAVVGAHLANRFKTVGPAATALVNLASLIWLLTV